MTLSLEKTEFQSLSYDEMVEVDGGWAKALDEGLVATAGGVAIAAGTVIAIVGVATLNPGIAILGGAAIVAGAEAFACIF